jgi:hypothetical protein
MRHLVRRGALAESFRECGHIEDRPVERHDHLHIELAPLDVVWIRSMR